MIIDDPTWYALFRKEMLALDCVPCCDAEVGDVVVDGSHASTEEWKIPERNLDAAQAVINKYMEPDAEMDHERMERLAREGGVPLKRER